MEDKIKQISVIYDDLAEEIRGVKRYSLPAVERIHSGKNYTSFKNLYLFLEKFNLLSNNCVRLYIRTQYELIWELPKYYGKVLPVNMMYNPRSMDRFIKFIREKEKKVGKNRLSKYLDMFIETPLIQDPNTASLRNDIGLVAEHLLLRYPDVAKKDVEEILTDIELGNIYSSNKHSVCPSYLFLSAQLDSPSDNFLKIFKNKFSIIDSSIKKRGKSYVQKLEERKEKIITDLIKRDDEVNKIMELL